jgi:hypothetical protein
LKTNQSNAVQFWEFVRIGRWNKSQLNRIRACTSLNWSFKAGWGKSLSRRGVGGRIWKQGRGAVEAGLSIGTRGLLKRSSSAGQSRLGVRLATEWVERTEDQGSQHRRVWINSGQMKMFWLLSIILMLIKTITPFPNNGFM